MTDTIFGILAVALSIFLGYVGYRVKRTKPGEPRAIVIGVVVGLVVALLSLVLWKGVLENIAARKWGGTMTINLPANAHLMNMTWKEDSVWYLYYDRGSGNCYFKEDSRHGLIEGGVIVKSCKPLGLAQ